MFRITPGLRSISTQNVCTLRILNVHYPSANLLKNSERSGRLRTMQLAKKSMRTAPRISTLSSNSISVSIELTLGHLMFEVFTRMLSLSRIKMTSLAYSSIYRKTETLLRHFLTHGVKGLSLLRKSFPKGLIEISLRNTRKSYFLITIILRVGSMYMKIRVDQTYLGTRVCMPGIMVPPILASPPSLTCSEDYMWFSRFPEMEIGVPVLKMLRSSSSKSSTDGYQSLL